MDNEFDGVDRRIIERSIGVGYNLNYRIEVMFEQADLVAVSDLVAVLLASPLYHEMVKAQKARKIAALEAEIATLKADEIEHK